MLPTTRLIASSHDQSFVRTVNPPLHRAATVLFDSYEDLMKAVAGEHRGITYGTDRLPTQRLFEEAMRDLEGGHLTRAFPSGIGALIGALQAFTKSGDHILLCDNVYGPIAHFCGNFLSKYGVEIGILPPNVGADVTEHLRPNTVLILLESPGSNTFEIQDIPAVAAIARERGVLTLLDNTWATPLLLDPFPLGVDATIHSVTKYISGHSDVLLGTVTATEHCAAALDSFYRTTESYAAPEDCHLALRGLRTLPVRLKQHGESALAIAHWLDAHDLIDTVIHPALPSHPEHHLWRRDFRGASGLFAFTLKEEYPQPRLAAFINSLQLFGLGFSWGGFKSLITAAKYPRVLPSRYAGRTVIRLSIGLEDPQDLWVDLEQGLDRLR